MLQEICEPRNFGFVSLLGVTLDYKLTFSSHINNSASKAGAQLCALNRIKCFLDKDARLTLAKTFILSHFRYCPIIWHFCGKVNANRLENIILEVFKSIRGINPPYLNDLFNRVKSLT